jgi:hypothetical protein
LKIACGKMTRTQPRVRDSFDFEFDGIILKPFAKSGKAGPNWCLIDKDRILTIGRRENRHIVTSLTLGVITGGRNKHCKDSMDESSNEMTGEGAVLSHTQTTTSLVLERPNCSISAVAAGLPKYAFSSIAYSATPTVATPSILNTDDVFEGKSSLTPSSMMIPSGCDTTVALG